MLCDRRGLMPVVVVVVVVVVTLLLRTILPEKLYKIREQSRGGGVV